MVSHGSLKKFVTNFRFYLFAARFSGQAADTIRNTSVFNLSGKFHKILEEITFFLKYDDFIMLIFLRFWGFLMRTFFPGKPILNTFKWDIIDHTTVNTCRDILINMWYGQFRLHLLYRDELNSTFKWTKKLPHPLSPQLRHEITAPFFWAPQILLISRLVLWGHLA